MRRALSALVAREGNGRTNLRTVLLSLTAAVLAVTVVTGCSTGDPVVTPPAVTVEAVPVPVTPAPIAPAPTSTPAPTTVARPPAPTSTVRPRPVAPTSTTRSRPPRDETERDWSCDMASDGVPVCEGDVPASVGEYRTPRQEIQRQGEAESDAALRSCVEQTGMTREECIADAAAGNAS